VAAEGFVVVNKVAVIIVVVVDDKDITEDDVAVVAEPVDNTAVVTGVTDEVVTAVCKLLAVQATSKDQIATAIKLYGINLFSCIFFSI